MTIVENSIIAFTGRFETFFEVSLFVCKILLSDTLIYVCIFCKLVTVFFFFFISTQPNVFAGSYINYRITSPCCRILFWSMGSISRRV